MEENKLNNVDLDKVNGIIANLDASGALEEFITEDVQTNIDDPELDANMYYDELGEAVYEVTPNLEGIKAAIKEVVTEPLTQEEFDLIVTVVSNNIFHKVNVKKNAARKATYRAEESDMIDYYGSKNSAFEHIYDKLMVEEFYGKPLESSLEDYIEYLGIKQNNR